MKTRYYDNGSHFHTVLGEEDGVPEAEQYVPVAGDFITDHMLSDAELAASFPQRAAIIQAQQATVMRSQRNQLLTASDWTQMPDTALTADQKAAWVTYRKALRNLPAETTNLVDVAWPTPPS